MYHLPADPESVRLSEARRIVAAGLGIGSREALPQVEELAELLGASTGASRPLADRGWVPSVSVAALRLPASEPATARAGGGDEDKGPRLAG